MNKKEYRVNMKNYLLDTSLFRKIYIVILSFEMIAFLDVISLALKCIILTWGFFVFVHNFLLEKCAFKTKYGYILWSFLAVMVIASTIHMSIWFVPNLVITYYTALCFFVFYGMYTQQNRDTCEKEMLFLFKFWSIFGAVFGILSLMILIFKSEINVNIGDFEYHLGIFKNRLIGVYTNSNILAFSMIQSLVSCDFLLNNYITSKFHKKNFPLWVIITIAAINCACLFLSDSNASFLFLVIYSTIRVFCNLLFKNKKFNGRRFLKSTLVSFGFCLVLSSICFTIRGLCQKTINIIINNVYHSEKVLKDKFNDSEPPNSVNSVNEEIHSIIIKNDDENTDLHIGRAHYEVSSGRITLFKQGLEIFKHNPIFGFGRANLGIYGKKYLKNGLVHSDLHNAYLTILVCYGVLGFVIFSAFIVFVAVDICKYLFKASNKYYFSVFVRIFSSLVAYLGYCIFEKAIMFDMTFMVGFFWIMLGFAATYVYNFSRFN